MQIDDILKAAIQDAGLEFFNTATNYSSPSSTNSSESSLNNLGLDDDFNLTDLDWNLLDQSEEQSPAAPTSISPTTQCSVQSPVILQAQQPATTQQQQPIDTIADDTDPFILALQELDEHNSKLDLHDQTTSSTLSNTQYLNNNVSLTSSHNQNDSVNNDHKKSPGLKQITNIKIDTNKKTTNATDIILNKPQTKIVTFNSTPTTTAKSSDLLSLINYRATSVTNKPSNKVFEIFKYNRGWKTKMWCISHK